MIFWRIHHCIRPSHRAGCDRPAKGQRAGRIPSSSGKYVPQRRDRFLDDLTAEDAEKALQVKVRIVKSSGRDFVKAVLYPELEAEQTEDEAGLGADYGYEGYELDELSDESYK